MRMVVGVTASTMMLLGTGSSFSADLGRPTPSFSLPQLTEEDNFVDRLYHAYADEWGKPPAVDPNAPPSRRSTAEIAPQPEDSPPYPFTEWPFGAASAIGATLPNSVDAPLQRALFPTTTTIGKALDDAHIQIYGWVNVGGNVSTAKTGYNGNAPAAYMYVPDIVQLDQAVMYIERLPDTVQKDHIDWGFRVSGMYGEDYRYTTALGVFSNQLLYHNHFAGYDMPMVYGELYIPYLAEGVVLRAGRYISIPDIEAQLAPNNYMYSHSLTYAYDNYTNTGLMSTWRLTKNWMIQFGINGGTETVPWNAKKISLINPTTGQQGYSGPRDPGAQASGAGCIQYQTDGADNAVYLCADAINNGTWGQNNLQWFGGTFYHKFNDAWHISLESYYMYQKNVFDVSQGYGNTPFAYMVDPPLEAHCGPGQVKCTAKEYSFLAYLNYKASPLDNVTLRTEFYNDENGQRTGYQTKYVDLALGVQHWFSPTVEIRPEVAWYLALDKSAFDNGTKHSATIAAMDVIWHY